MTMLMVSIHCTLPDLFTLGDPNVGDIAIDLACSKRVIDEQN
jgi:hypothetical protein